MPRPSAVTAQGLPLTWDGQRAEPEPGTAAAFLREHPDIVAKLHRELVRTLEAPAVREQLEAQGVDPWPGTPEQFRAMARAESKRWGEIIQAAGVKLD